MMDFDKQIRNEMVGDENIQFIVKRAIDSLFPVTLSHQSRLRPENPSDNLNRAIALIKYAIEIDAETPIAPIVSLHKRAR